MLSIFLTHLSDYSYLERGFHSVLILAWIIHRISSCQGWAEFNWSAIKQFRLKICASVLVILSITVMIAYDIIVSYCKYQEGYIVNSTGSIVLRPKSSYTDLHKKLIIAGDSLLDFMLLATFNHVVSEQGHASFMASWEFKVYRVYSIVSVLLYGILQAVFSYDATLTAVVPQFVYHCECFLISNLLQLTNYRIRKLLPSLTNPTTRLRMHQFLLLNNFLSVCLFLDFLGLFIINTDILVGHKDVQDSKFWTDFLTVIFNSGFNLGYVVIVLILYPAEAVVIKDPQITQMRGLVAPHGSNSNTNTKSGGGKSNMRASPLTASMPRDSMMRLGAVTPATTQRKVLQAPPPSLETRAESGEAAGVLKPLVQKSVPHQFNLSSINPPAYEVPVAADSNSSAGADIVSPPRGIRLPSISGNADTMSPQLPLSTVNSPSISISRRTIRVHVPSTSTFASNPIVGAAAPTAYLPLSTSGDATPQFTEV